ncbi:MAG: type III-B CRISPR module RAMP protein Cmr6 [Marinosulfonomonas sp.]|nr:type III-B CRISPR module RAMP protein Cmr6 [Marinosulfonomonas sp.]
MLLPLPEQKIIKSRTPYGNKGLVFQKFFDQWPAHAELGRFSGPGEEKKTFLERFIGQSPDASKAAKRIRNLAVSQGGNVKGFTTTAPFLTGTGLPHPVENGFLWHHTYGVPYIPGSSVKGVLRTWAEHWIDVEPEEVIRLFGNPDGVGRLILFDAFPRGEVTLYTEVITPHIGDWRITDKPENSPPADWVSPVPIPFLALAPGAEFQFALAPRHGPKVDMKTDLALGFEFLAEALKWMGAGARTAAGFGIFGSDDDIQAAEEQELEVWRSELKDGDEVGYHHGSGVIHVRLRDVGLADGKVGIVRIDTGKGMGRKLVSTLKPWQD